MKYDIHDDEENDRERFVLGSAGMSKLFVLGVNPSTANKDESDRTITKVIKFSRGLDFPGFVMLNIYPQRATNPGELNSKPDDNLVGRNTKIIRSQVPNEGSPQIWAAWGDLICSRDYLWDCLSKIAHELKKNPIWNHCGQPTKQGHPRHPSRLAYKEEFFKFNIFEYLEKKRIVKK